MQELFPLACGLLLGAALGFVRPTLRLPVGAAMAVVLGVLATVATGEFKTSWSFVLIDIPLVALAAVVGLLTHKWSERVGYAGLADMAVHQLDLYAAGLESELSKYESLPSILELDENVFEIVNQLNRGIELVSDREELDRIAELNAKAGQRAKAATANVTSLALLRTGAAENRARREDRGRHNKFFHACLRMSCGKFVRPRRPHAPLALLIMRMILSENRSPLLGIMR